MRLRGLIRATPAMLAVAAGSACSSPPAATGEFATDPIASVTSQSGALTLAAYTAPGQPPPRGMVKVKLVVRDAATHAPVDGVDFAVEPLMPSMGHGTSVVPRTTPEGDGTYLIEDVKLYMVGRWDLHMTMTGAVNDGAIVSVDVY
jgi:hypothetical protein